MSLGHGDRSDGGVFHADHAILARARLPVRQSDDMAAGRSIAALRGLQRGGGRGVRGESAPKGMAAGVKALGGLKPQTLQLLIGRFMPERRVGARTWMTKPPKAQGQAPAGLAWDASQETTDFPRQGDAGPKGLHVHWRRFSSAPA